MKMDKEINLHRLRLVIRGALDYLNREGATSTKP